MEESGAAVDLAGALVNFFKQVGGITISREERLPIIMRILMKMS